MTKVLTYAPCFPEQGDIGSSNVLQYLDSVKIAKHTETKKKILTKCKFKPFPSPATAPKFYQRRTTHENVYFEIKSLSVMVLWLPRYFCYSTEAKRVEYTGIGGDKSINSLCHVIVNEFFVSKNQKEKKTSERRR